MKRLMINAGSYGLFLFKYLLLELNKIGNNITKIYVEKNRDDVFVIIEEPDSQIEFLSKALSQYIFRIYESEIVGSLIGNLSQFYDNTDRFLILEKTNEKLARYKDRKDSSEVKAHANIMELLRSSYVFNIEGFIVFRLKEYIFFLRKLVEEAMDDFLCEKEQEEFLQILSHFVKMQETRTDTVHILCCMDDGCSLYSSTLEKYRFYEKGEPIEKPCLPEESEDILVGMLVSLLPKTIVLHDYNRQVPKTLWDILAKVFQDRVKICEECPDCTLCQNTTAKNRPV